MLPKDYRRLTQFLANELAIAPDSIEIALEHCRRDPGPLPIVLWQHGIVTMSQLERIYDWLESA